MAQHTAFAPDILKTSPRPRRSEWVAVVLIMVLITVFGAFHVIRSAVADRQMTPAHWEAVEQGEFGRFSRTKTDLGVYLRAAWAVRTGIDPYTVADDNGWHYHYPPLLAILLTPFADPPYDLKDDGWYLPFVLSKSLWYILSAILALAAIHVVASALEATVLGRGSPRPAFHDPDDHLQENDQGNDRGYFRGQIREQIRGSRWWLLLRLIPLVVCVPVLGRALARGQVGPLLAFLICAAAAELVRRRNFRAGMWLAGAICLKIIPAFLLLVPLWRRDGRCLAGCAVGLAIGLIVIPVATIGPQRTIDSYGHIAREVIGPAVGDPTGTTRAEELTAVNATGSNAPVAVIHNLLHMDVPRNQRPTVAATWVKATHWSIGLILTLVTLWAARLRPVRPRFDPIEPILFLGALTMVHIILSPVSHPHYYIVALLPIVGLVAASWRRHPEPRLSRSVDLAIWFFFFSHVLTAAQVEVLKEGGLVLLGGLVIWAVTIVELRRITGGVSCGDHEEENPHSTGPGPAPERV